jgi:tRNA-dihydrouridine synthase 1
MEAPKKKKKRPQPTEPTPAAKKQQKSKPPPPLPPHKYVLAPMVGGSEIAFRLLCRRYSSQNLLAYTPMMSSERFAVEPKYREEAFQSCPEDRPLVAHFSGNDPAVMLAAAKHIEGHCDAVDLNLGCPQRIAHSGHFGSFLLDDVDRPLVLSIVRTLASNLSIPVFVKIRLLETTEKTIDLVSSLRDAGARLIAIHARHRVSLVGRSGPTARDGPALLDEVAKIRQAVKGVALLSNGNVKTWEDVKANAKHTGADGVMSAEGILDDPAIFFPSCSEGMAGVGGGGGGPTPDGAAAAGLEEEVVEKAAREERRMRKKLREIERLEARVGSGVALSKEEKAKVESRAAVKKQLKRCKKLAAEAAEAKGYGTRDGGGVAAGNTSNGGSSGTAKAPPASKPTPLQLATEYMALAIKWNVPLRTLVFHVRRMLKNALTEYQLMGDMLEAKDADAVKRLIDQCAEFKKHGYKPDPDKARKEKEALELKKHREQTRKRYEERMVRKAKREGRVDDYYLKQGAAAPTADELRELKSMPPQAAWERWKERHAQHCYALHVGEGGCTRERTCAFLHADIAGASEPAKYG